jgi:general stress protein YciG
MRHKTVGRVRMRIMSDNEKISVAEAGRRGGQSTLEHRGTEFFRQIGRKGGQRTAELYGELLRGFGRKGGCPRRPPLDESVGEKDH